MTTSRIPGFHKMSVEERISVLKEFAGLSEEEVKLLKASSKLGLDKANIMIENVSGTFELPFGIATNFLINDKDYLVPMVLEEPSVVAAASFAAKLARESGGFKAKADEPVMIVQVQLRRIKDIAHAIENLKANKKRIIDMANEKAGLLLDLGGGARDFELRQIKTPSGKMLIFNLLVDVRDAMGANTVNTMAEHIAPLLEDLTAGQALFKIVSNLAIYRKAYSKAVWRRDVLEDSTKGKLSGEEVVDNILDGYYFAYYDQFRATTHNKGIMNGISAVAIATGNDFRAVEAGVHSYAAYGHEYRPVTRYYKDEKGDLVGEIEIPLAVGTVGGSIRTNPMAQIALKILRVKTAQELSMVMASVGLAQNFAALRAIATEGIQHGHMRLHARNIALMAGARGEEIDRIAAKLYEEKNFSSDRAKQLLEEMRKN